MNETNVGSGGSLNKIFYPDASQVVPFSPALVNYTDSALSLSEIQVPLVSLVSGSPQLQSPRLHVDDYVLAMANKMAQISIESLEAWGKSLEEMAARIKEELNSPAYLAKQEEERLIAKGSPDGLIALAPPKKEAIAATQGGEAALAGRYVWLEALGAIIAGAQAVAGVQSGGSAIGAVEAKEKLDIANQGNKVADPGTPQFIAQSLLIVAADATLFQSSAMVSSLTAGSLHLESKVIQEAWVAISANAADVATLAAGWVSALWGIGLIYQMSAEKIATQVADKPKEKALDMNFAKTYAEKVLAMVDTSAFTSTMKAILYTTVERTPATETSTPDFNTLIAKSKLMLLSLALALVGKLEVGSHADRGWINEMEFDGLLDGKTDLSLNDLFKTASLKRALITKINVLLASLDPSERAEVRAGLRAYMSRNPSVESLLDQQTAIALALNPPTLDEGLSELITPV